MANEGDLAAIRRVADLIAQGQSPDHLPPGAGPATAAGLYAVGASQGDVQSLLGLGWMLRDGVGTAPRNATAALRVFSYALQSELLQLGGGWGGPTTFGLAPALAYLSVWTASVLDAGLLRLRSSARCVVDG